MLESGIHDHSQNSKIHWTQGYIHKRVARKLRYKFCVKQKHVHKLPHLREILTSIKKVSKLYSYAHGWNVNV